MKTEKNERETFEIRNGGKKERRLLGHFDRFLGLVPLFNDVDLQEMLPSAVGEQTQSHQLGGDLLRRFEDADVVGGG